MSFTNLSRIHDVALQNLPVVLCLDRAGVVGEDGATHHGMFDLAAYRAIPGCVVAAPADSTELKMLMYSALHHEGGPYIIRYPRGGAEGVPYKDAPFTEMVPGKGEVLRSGEKVAIVAIGHCSMRALGAADMIEAKLGFVPTVIDIRFLKPMDEALVLETARSHGYVVTVEDGCLTGGLYGAVTELLARHNLHPVITGLGIPDNFIEQDTQKAQRAACKIDEVGIAQTVENIFSKKVLENKE